MRKIAIQNPLLSNIQTVNKELNRFYSDIEIAM